MPVLERRLYQRDVCVREMSILVGWGGFCKKTKTENRPKKTDKTEWIDFLKKKIGTAGKILHVEHLSYKCFLFNVLT